MNYNFSDADKYAKSLGLFLLPDKVAEFDQLASAHGFTQAQVDVAMQLHLRQIAYVMNPKSYRWYQRICLALWFLFGRKK